MCAWCPKISKSSESKQDLLYISYKLIDILGKSEVWKTNCCVVCQLMFCESIISSIWSLTLKDYSS